VVSAAAGDFPDAALDALRVDAVPVLDDGGADGPISLPVPTGVGSVSVRVPPDIEQLRVDAPELGRRWRAAIREAMVARLAGGWTIGGCTRNGWYVLVPPPPEDGEGDRGARAES